LNRPFGWDSKEIVTVRATLFDFNGVLVDDEHLHYAAFRDVLKQIELPLTERDYFDKYVGLDDVGVFRAVLSAAGRTISVGVTRQLVAEKKPRYLARIATDLRVFPGALELLARRAGLGPVGIVSGALEDEIRHCLERLDAAKHVAFVIPAEQTTAGKPDPEGYRLARAELVRRGVPEGRAVVIEDTKEGVRAAKAAGLRCAAVTHTCAAEALTEAGADVVVTKLDDLDDRSFDGADT
jgi:beta-phosphoglucomutase-like phosphatase (HAD superfamily)